MVLTQVNIINNLLFYWCIVKFINKYLNMKEKFKLKKKKKCAKFSNMYSGKQKNLALNEIFMTAK